MAKKFFPLPLIVCLLLTMFLCVRLSMANRNQTVDTPSSVAVSSDSVLRFIPEKTLGLVYSPNLLELDNKINILVAELSPQTKSPKIFAQILANTLDADFESLADFEAIGLDVNRDFAIFFTSLKPMRLSVAARLTDTETIKQVIEAETGESALTEYKDVAYWSANGDGNSFTILEDMLIISQHREVCESVIDTHNGTMPAITANLNFETFLVDILEGTDQLGVCFDIEGITASFNGAIEEEWKSMIDTLSDNDQLSLLIEPSLKNISGEQLAFVAQLQSVNAKLQVKGTDVQITPSIDFKKDSGFVNVLQEVSADLTHLGELPNRATLNAAFQGSSKLLTEISTSWLDFTPQDIRNKQEKGDQLLEQVKEFYESLADRWSISTSFGDGVLPNHLFIYELKDEQRAKTYIDEMFLEKLNFKTAYVGPSTIHNGVEIKSYIFPNLKAAFEETQLETLDLDVIPPEWHWYYAFTDGHLFFATGTNPQLIQTALDRRTGNSEKFSNHPSYQGLIGKLGANNNILLAVSPIIALKSMLPVIEQMEPESVMLIQMYSGMLMNLPESY
ncbi:hypothetical protein C6503_15590, partial [Candidatus Poribacteria bacterium]